MASKYYLKTNEVVELTGRPYSDILHLVNNGVISGYKTRRGHWLLKIDAVEKYFGIQIDNEIGAEKKSIKAKSPHNPKRDYIGKIICGRTARKLLKCSKAEFENLVNQGHIQAYRDDYLRWKVSKDSVLNYVRRTQFPSQTRLIINEEHYEEVIERICSAKSSIKIMTANFKRFRLKPTEDQGINYGTPFIECLMEKAVQGVSIQIICSRPSQSFTNEWMELFKKMNNPKLFEYRFSDRNHSKVYIIDNKYAYVGSANVTSAGIRQDTFSIQNFEAGILTDNPDLVSSIRDFFSEIWDKD